MLKYITTHHLDNEDVINTFSTSIDYISANMEKLSAYDRLSTELHNTLEQLEFHLGSYINLLNRLSGHKELYKNWPGFVISTKNQLDTKSNELIEELNERVYSLWDDSDYMSYNDIIVKFENTLGIIITYLEDISYHTLDYELMQNSRELETLSPLDAYAKLTEILHEHELFLSITKFMNTNILINLSTTRNANYIKIGE